LRSRREETQSCVVLHARRKLPALPLSRSRLSRAPEAEAELGPEPAPEAEKLRDGEPRRAPSGAARGRGEGHGGGGGAREAAGDGIRAIVFLPCKGGVLEFGSIVPVLHGATPPFASAVGDARLGCGMYFTVRDLYRGMSLAFGYSLLEIALPD